MDKKNDGHCIGEFHVVVDIPKSPACAIYGDVINRCILVSCGTVVIRNYTGFYFLFNTEA